MKSVPSYSPNYNDTSRHRMTKQGRKEASRTTEVAYYLLESIATQRMTRLLMYSERLKKIGLPSGEVSRIRQYERFLSDIVEQLRMVKMYRSPQALRSFARIFTLLLPPFYAPTFAQVAMEVNSLGMGIAFGIITALGLTALFESLQVLEDPFTAFLALDGIDVREVSRCDCIANCPSAQIEIGMCMPFGHLESNYGSLTLLLGHVNRLFFFSFADSLSLFDF